MNKLLSNVLIVLALAMCALCAYQWSRETRQREEVAKLNKHIFEKDLAIQGYTNSIHISDRKIAQLDARIGELKDTVKTNETTLLQQRREITKLEYASAALTNQIDEYKAAVETYQARLKEAFDGVQKQNELIKTLGDERNDLVARLNESMKERNEIVAKHNELVKMVETLQSALTNAPPARQPARSGTR